MVNDKRKFDENDRKLLDGPDDFQLDDLDLESEIDSDNFAFDTFDTDSDRDPATKSKIGKEATGAFARGVGTGIGKVINRKLDKEFPKTKSLANEALGLSTEVYKIKQSVNKDLGPTLGQIKTASKQILPRVETYLPKKMYAKIDKLLESKDSDRFGTSNYQSDTRNEVLANVLTEIFTEDKKDRIVEDTISRSVEAARHKESTTISDRTRVLIEEQLNFTKNIYTPYLKKSLELKYRHLYVSQDILEASKSLANILITKLDEIRQNTALPDVQKQKLTESFKDTFRQNLGSSISSLFSQSLRNIATNVKENIIDPSEFVLSTLVGGPLDMLNMSMEMEESFGEKKSLSRRLLPFGASVLGGVAAKGALGKPINQVMSTLKEKYGDEADLFSKHGMTMAGMAINDLKNDYTKKDSLSRFITQAVLSDFSLDDTEVKNSLIEDPTKEAIFDRLTRTSITEIIPGYLSEILKVSTEIRDGGVSSDKIIYDPFTRQFTNESEVSARFEKDVAGSEFSRTYKASKFVGAVQKGLDRNSDKGLSVEKVGKDLTRVFNNLSTLKKLPIIRMDDIRKAYQFNNFELTEYIETMFKGVKNPEAVMDVIYHALHRPDGSEDVKTKIKWASLILSQINEFDSYKSKVEKYVNLGLTPHLSKYTTKDGIASEITLDKDVLLDRLSDVNESSLYDVSRSKESLIEQKEKELRELSGKLKFKDIQARRKEISKLKGEKEVTFGKLLKDSTKDTLTKVIGQRASNSISSAIDKVSNFRDRLTDPLVEKIDDFIRNKMPESFSKPTVDSNFGLRERLKNLGIDEEEVNTITEDKVKSRVVIPSSIKGEEKDRIEKEVSKLVPKEVSGISESVPSKILFDNEIKEGILNTAKNTLLTTELLSQIKLTTTDIFSLLLDKDTKDKLKPSNRLADLFRDFPDKVRSRFSTIKDSIFKTSDSIFSKIPKIFDKEKFDDLYQKGTNKLLVTKEKLRKGLIDSKGKVIKTLKDITGPLFDPSTNETVLSEEQIEEGVTDSKGKSVGKLGLGDRLREGFGLLGKMLPGARKAASILTYPYKIPFKIAGTTIDFLSSKRAKYQDVYIKNRMSEGPVLLGKNIKKGMYAFADGTILESALKITGPVFEIVNGEVSNQLLSEDDIKQGLVNAKGEDLGKGYFLRKLDSSLTFKAVKSIPSLLGKTFEIGKSTLKGIGNILSDILPDSLSKLIPGVSKDKNKLRGRRKDLEEIVGKRLDTIINLISPGTVKGDKDNDGDRDNSYEDFKNQQKEKEEKRKFGPLASLSKLFGKGKGLFGALGLGGAAGASSTKDDKSGDGEGGILEEIFGTAIGNYLTGGIGLFGKGFKSAGRLLRKLPFGIGKTLGKGADLVTSVAGKFMPKGLLSKAVPNVAKGGVLSSVSKGLGKVSKLLPGRLGKRLGLGAAAIGAYQMLSDDEEVLASDFNLEDVSKEFRDIPYPELLNTIDQIIITGYGFEPGEVSPDQIEELPNYVSFILEASVHGKEAEISTATEISKALKTKRTPEELVYVFKNRGKKFRAIHEKLLKKYGVTNHKQIQDEGLLRLFATDLKDQAENMVSLLDTVMDAGLTGAAIAVAKRSPILAGLIDSVTSIRDSYRQFQSGDKESAIKTGVTGISGAVVGAVGAAKGAAMGAALGSIVPGVGTIAGGIIGGAIGYFAGNWVGTKLTEGIAGTAAKFFTGEAGPGAPFFRKDPAEWAMFKYRCSLYQVDPVKYEEVITDIEKQAWNTLNDAFLSGLSFFSPKVMTDSMAFKYLRALGFNMKEKADDKIKYFHMWYDMVVFPVVQATAAAMKTLDLDFDEQDELSLKDVSSIINEIDKQLKPKIELVSGGLIMTEEGFNEYSNTSKEETDKYKPTTQEEKQIAQTVKEDRQNAKTKSSKNTTPQDEDVDKVMGFAQMKKGDDTTEEDKIKNTISQVGVAGTASETGSPYTSVDATNGVGGNTRSTLPVDSDILGTVSSHFENGGKDSNAIGYDSTGGTSYGKYQLASKAGMLAEFIRFAKSNGAEKFANEMIDAVGTVPGTGEKARGWGNTGKTTGKPVDVWMKAAQDGTLGNLEHEFMKSQIMNALKGIKDDDLRSFVEGSPALMEMFWSTVVQHGAGGARSIFTKAFKPNISEEAFIEAVYRIRSTKFGSSTPKVRTSVMNRFNNESRMIRELLKKEKDKKKEEDYSLIDSFDPDIATESEGPAVRTASSSTSKTVSEDHEMVETGGIARPTKTKDLTTSGDKKKVSSDVKVDGSMDAVRKATRDVDLENLHPRLKASLDGLSKEFKDKFNAPLTVTSGYRSRAKQQALYNADPTKAARPNPRAPHMFEVAGSPAAIAFDASSRDLNKADESGLLDKWGLHRPLWPNGKGRVKAEPWHVQLKGLNASTAADMMETDGNEPTKSEMDKSRDLEIPEKPTDIAAKNVPQIETTDRPITESPVTAIEEPKPQIVKQVAEDKSNIVEVANQQLDQMKMMVEILKRMDTNIETVSKWNLEELGNKILSKDTPATYPITTSGGPKTTPGTKPKISPVTNSTKINPSIINASSLPYPVMDMIAR